MTVSEAHKLCPGDLVKVVDIQETHRWKDKLARVSFYEYSRNIVRVTGVSPEVQGLKVGWYPFRLEKVADDWWDIWVQ